MTRSKPDAAFSLIVSYYSVAHLKSIAVISRLSRVTFEAQPSEYTPKLRFDPALQSFAFAEIKTDFEFLVNSNSFLRVTPK